MAIDGWLVHTSVQSCVPTHFSFETCTLYVTLNSEDSHTHVDCLPTARTGKIRQLTDELVLPRKWG